MKKKTLILPIMLATTISLAGCKPYDKPEYVTVQPNQTAFVIPLTGKTSEQKAFESEKYLAEMQVATKRIQVPHEWVKTGRLPSSGKYIPTIKVIVVDRYPETREWSDSKSFIGESKDSIKFNQGISATAQIEEKDSSVFLYQYSGKKLKEVMDKEVKNKIGSVLLEKYSTMNIEQIRKDKKTVIRHVESEVVPYFKEKGITLSNIGFIGDMKYVDDKIQTAINKKFNAEEEAKARAIESESDVKEAKNEAQAAKIRAASIKEIKETHSLKVKEKELEIQSKIAEKWDGELPSVSGTDSIISLPEIK